MPWLFDRKSWKIWRKCYKDDNVNKRYSCDLGESYVWPELGYEAVVFKSPGFESGYECALFDISDGKLVFSSFYTMHSVKMTVKLKNTHA